METIEANVFANTKCPSCREEWNNETGEIFEASLAKLLRKRSGVHDVPAILCAECQEDETWQTVQQCALDLRSLAQELANASMRRDTERCGVMIDDMIGLLAEAQGVFPARYARSLARPAVIVGTCVRIEHGLESKIASELPGQERQTWQSNPPLSSSPIAKGMETFC